MSTDLMSVLACSEQDLPQLLRTALSYRTVRASSTTTQAAVPPWFLLCKPGLPFQIIAEEFLKANTTKSSDLALQPLGTVFQQITLDNETDLVVASSLYVIRPLLAILQLKYGTGSFTMTSEQHARTEHLGGEKATRVDLVFRTKDDRQTAILIIEYKRREQIVYADYEQALLSVDAPDALIEDQTKRSQKAKGNTALVRTVISYTKQVAMYAKQNKCKHIVLLNWDHLLLFEFNKLQEAGTTKDKTSAGKTAELTWVSEQRDGEGEHITKGSMRKALLGFALQAFKEHIPPLAVN